MDSTAEEYATMSSLPLIDFTPWTSNAPQEDRLKAAHDLVDGCRRAGFVYISNHGVPEAMVEEAFAWAKKFFDLPREDKMKVERDSLAFRGYNSTGVQRVPRVLRVRGGDPTAEGWLPDYNVRPQSVKQRR
jgi:isopenicillin N synthase-like dioxygenase